MPADELQNCCLAVRFKEPVAGRLIKVTPPSKVVASA
jgi:hypothetical protein